MRHPTPAEVIALREAVQAEADIGITAAQDHCAQMLHTSRRAWQQWERGDRKMHPAFWELAKLKNKSQYSEWASGVLDRECGVQLTVSEILDRLNRCSTQQARIDEVESQNVAMGRISSHHSIQKSNCDTYDFASKERPDRIIRVVRIVREPDPQHDLVDFPGDYQSSHPECGDVLDMAVARLVIDE